LSDPFLLLDIDLDAFLDNVAHWVRGIRRLNSRHYKPWAQDRLREFLENRCHLSRSNRVTGNFAVHHTEAFDYLMRIAEDADALVAVAHIDGHADLGMGGSSWVYLTRDILARPPEGRTNPRRGPKSVNAGSYLAFALATRRIASLTYVHPAGGGADLPEMLFADDDPASGMLQLKRFSPEVIRVIARNDEVRLTPIADIAIRSLRSLGDDPDVMQPGPVPTLWELQNTTPWVWLWCERCQHHGVRIRPRGGRSGSGRGSKPSLNVTRQRLAPRPLINC
jgi:hypothetical protein